MPSPFTAALLAGGKSQRMGKDKAFLPVEYEGASMPLWQRQLAVLRSVDPEKLVISGPRKRGYPASVQVWADRWDDVGPLGGIATCLSRARSALLLVLAVDLPKIQPGFLNRLLSLSQVGCGVVPIHQNRFEPLIAIYPKAAFAAAVAQIRKENYALQHFIDELCKNRLMDGYEVDVNEEHQLQNWNTPNDVE